MASFIQQTGPHVGLSDQRTLKVQTVLAASWH